MPGPSKVIVLDPDSRAGRQVQLGFSREGVPSALADTSKVDLPADDTSLVIVGGTDGAGLDLLRKTRLALDEKKLDVPIVFTGRGVRRTDAEAAGADEVVLLPAFLRDVVTIGRLLKGQPAGQRDHIVGSLAETTGVFTLVRALAALGRSAVLTLIRGLRRGEIRFFHGEVTSAQVGLIHGQAAFHQLLLWTEARFEFRHEDVVRRHQIPLSPEELFVDAERFLEGVRDSSGQLSPSMVLEQDMTRVSALGKQIPTEVHGVLRMFDGHRVLADILEDSPYRVFETLRVAQRACDVGLLKIVDSQKPKPTWRAVLAIEEWLVGSDRDAVIRRPDSANESVPAAEPAPKGKGGKKKRNKKRRALTPLPIATTIAATSRADIDWGALVPRVVGAEVGSLSGVVPASQQSGEISLPPREQQREKLEALMDTEKREKIFPKEIGLEPKVVFDAGEDLAKHEAEAAPDDTAARRKEEAAEAEDVALRAEAADRAKQLAAARTKATEDQAREAEELAKRLADAKANAEAEARAAEEARAEEAMRRDTEDAKRAVADTVSTAATTETAPDLVKQLLGEGVTTSENPNATVVVHEHMTVDTTVNTARVVSESLASITSSTPEELTDEPSDGIVRQMATVETAPVRRPPPGEIPPDDRPEARKGEIAPRSQSTTSQPVVAEPSILIADQPVVAEPSALIADLAAAHTAVSAVVTAQAAAPASKDIAQPAREQVVAEVRKDAVLAFSDDEEEFFKAGAANTGKVPQFAPETFDDLDEGYQPVGFWDRLRGKKPTKPGKK